MPTQPTMTPLLVRLLLVKPPLVMPPHLVSCTHILSTLYIVITFTNYFIMSFSLLVLISQLIRSQIKEGPWGTICHFNTWNIWTNSAAISIGQGQGSSHSCQLQDLGHIIQLRTYEWLFLLVVISFLEINGCKWLLTYVFYFY